MMKKYILTNLLILGCFIFGTQALHAQVFTVNTSTDGNGIGTLRWAVAQANSSATPSTINFDMGVDFTPIEITQGRMFIYKSVTIDGNGIGHTLIDGTNSNQAFVIGGSVNVTIKDLSFQNCASVGQSQFSNGGAIAHVGGNLTIDNCRFVNNTATWGGGIAQDAGVLSIKNSLFQDNTVTGYGGALSLGNGQTTIFNTKINGNSASSGGAGIRTSYNNSLTVANSEIRGNEAGSQGGGGVHLTGVQYTFINTLISGNSSGGGGGVLATTGSGEFTNCTIAGNYCSYSWGGNALLAGGGSTVTLKNCIVAKNTGVSGNSLLTLPSGGQPAGTINSLGGNFFGYADPNHVTLMSSDLTGTGSYPLNPNFKSNPPAAPSMYGNYALKSCSNAINQGVDANLPQDVMDIDQDGNTTETLPLDIVFATRIYIDPYSSTNSVDAGAYEYHGMKMACSAPGPKGPSMGFRTMSEGADLFPNPSNGNTTISLTNKEQSLTHFEVYDWKGSLIMKESPKGDMNQVKLHLNNQKPGIYLFKGITTTGEIIQKKFIIE